MRERTLDSLKFATVMKTTTAMPILPILYLDSTKLVTVKKKNSRKESHFSSFFFSHTAAAAAAIIKINNK